MNNIRRKLVNNVFLNISIFRMVYLCVLFLCSFCFAEIPFNGVKYAMLVWGGVIIYYYYIKPKRYFDVLYARWLVGFLFASLITLLVHITDNFLTNFVLLCHIVICFFVLYGMHTEKNKKRKRKELYLVSLIIVATTTVAMVIGFVLLFWGEQKIVFFNSTYKMVIYENRFTGIVTNPNLLGFYAVVAIVCAHILSKRNLYKEFGIEKKIPNWLLIVSAVINAVGLFLSDSNGALLLFICYGIGYFIYYVFGGVPKINIKGFALRCCGILLASVIAVGFSVGLRWCVNTGVSVAINSVSTQIVVPNKPNDKPAVDKGNVGIVTFAHENDNLDSGRISLLQKAVVVFYNNPIFGVGKENILLYGKRLLETGFKYKDLHNGYLTILVSNGLVGFALFIGFAVSLGRHCVKSLFLEKKKLRGSPFVCLFAFIFGYCIYAVVEKTLLMEQTYMVAIFWYFLGYASCYMCKYNHINDTFDIKSMLIGNSNKDTSSIDIIDVPTEDNEADDTIPISKECLLEK